VQNKLLLHNLLLYNKLLAMEFKSKKVEDMATNSFDLKGEKFNFNIKEFLAEFSSQITSAFAPTQLLLYDCTTHQIAHASKEYHEVFSDGQNKIETINFNDIWELITTRDKINLTATLPGVLAKIKTLIENKTLDNYIVTLQYQAINKYDKKRWILNQFVKIYTNGSKMVGIVMKCTDITHLKSTAQHSAYLYSKVENKIVEYFEVTFPQETIITPREKEIFQLLQQGYLEKEIAQKLTLSVSTIKNHKQNVFKKLKTYTTIEATNLLQDLKQL
jgi:DNA-binding CsgD family transcriptional regulator